MTATVAERGGKARAIRNRSPRHVQPQSMQANLRTPNPAPKAGAPGEGRRNHLRLVADHGRVIDPAFLPQQAATPGEPVPNREAGDAPRPVMTAPRREARTAGQGQRQAGRERAAEEGAGRERAAGERAHLERAAERQARRGRAEEQRAAAGRRPVRLTRRGRLVVTSTIVLLIAIASMALASAAQAAGHPS